MGTLHQLQTALQTYHDQVDQFKTTEDWPDRAVLALLRSRDRVQSLIDQLAKEAGNADLPPNTWFQLTEDDTQVTQWATNQLNDVTALPDWRRSIQPPVAHWWWYPKLEAPKPLLGWLLGGLTLAFIALSLAFAKDIATRFFTGAPGIWSSIGAVVPVVLALFATGGALTKLGQQLVDAYLTQRVPYPRYWPLIKCSLALLLLLGFFAGHVWGLPWAAERYFAAGKQQYFDNGQLSQAQASFARSLQLNPDFPAANHHLALIYEDLRELGQAKAEYTKATQGSYLRSANNLARLLILDENYDDAAVLLLGTLRGQARDREDKELEYGLQKNLGWVRLEQDRLTRAEGALNAAIEIEKTLEGDRPDAYCLLGQLQQRQNQLNQARESWNTCDRKASRPEDDMWRWMARDALAALNGEPATDNTPPPTN